MNELRDAATARLLLCTVFVMLFAVSWAHGQTASAGLPTKNDPQNLLDQFSGAVESMVRRVSPAVVQVLATTTTLMLSVTPVDVDQPSARLADLSDVAKSQITQLGIMAVTLDDRIASMIGPVRLASGAVVVAGVPSPNGAIVDLRQGDLIHEVNGKTVFSVESLKAALGTLKSGDGVALLVERSGRWFYSAFNMP